MCSLFPTQMNWLCMSVCVCMYKSVCVYWKSVWKVFFRDTCLRTQELFKNKKVGEKCETRRDCKKKGSCNRWNCRKKDNVLCLCSRSLIRPPLFHLRCLEKEISQKRNCKRKTMAMTKISGRMSQSSSLLLLLLSECNVKIT